MLNIISFLFGLVAIILALPSVIPFLGWVNWITLPIVAVGVIFGFLSSKNGGRNFCLVVMALCAFRLFIGGGVI